MGQRKHQTHNRSSLMSWLDHKVCQCGCWEGKHWAPFNNTRKATLVISVPRPQINKSVSFVLKKLLFHQHFVKKHFPLSDSQLNNILLCTELSETRVNRVIVCLFNLFSRIFHLKLDSKERRITQNALYSTSSASWIKGNWTSCRFLKTFHFSSEKLLQFWLTGTTAQEIIPLWGR